MDAILGRVVRGDRSEDVNVTWDLKKNEAATIINYVCLKAEDTEAKQNLSYWGLDLTNE